MSDENKQVINFTCPFCEKECLENQRVIIDMNDWQMAHEKCVEKHLKELQENQMVVTDGDIDPNTLQG